MYYVILSEFPILGQFFSQHFVKKIRLSFSASSSMNKLLLLRPISRAVCVQRPVTCYRHLNKSFSTTVCRKFGSTLIKRTEGGNVPPPADTAVPLTLQQENTEETEETGPLPDTGLAKDYSSSKLLDSESFAS